MTIRPKVLFFDSHETLLDLKKMKDSVKHLLGGREDLVPFWFAAMFHYSLVATVAGQFKPFRDIAVAAMMMVARSNNLDINERQADEAIEPIRFTPPQPDAIPALKRLKAEGFYIGLLTNSFENTMASQLEFAKLSDYFNITLSAEAAGIYKPHRDIYKWAAGRVGKWPTDCLLVTAHGWDVAGALWNGMRAAFVIRPGQELYPLAPMPEIIEPDLERIADRLIRLP